MPFAQRMRDKAKKLNKNLVLPEGTEPRTIQAARIIVDEELAASVTLLGVTEDIQKAASQVGVDLGGITLLDPQTSENLDDFAEEYYNLRKHKGMTREQAKQDIPDVLRWGCMMVRKGISDGLVAGAENSTGDVLRAALTIIKTSPGTKYASSCFVMVLPEEKWGINGNLVFSDCAIIPEPTSEQLAEIAIAAAESCKTFLEAEPVVALLSYSTKGSAQSESVERVINALPLIKGKAPELQVDGEIQADAALIQDIGQRKAPGSPVAGKANVLIFPDLAAGNIGYKLVQRLAHAEAYGPFLQGFAKPVSDLSRGCSVNDIVNTAAVTLAKNEKK
jgi:phosphate acetyltransferase